MLAGAVLGFVAFVAWLIWIVFIWGEGVSDMATGGLVLGSLVMLLFSTLWAVVGALILLGVGAVVKLLAWIATGTPWPNEDPDWDDAQSEQSN
jgi:hypothetical protein